MTRPIVTEEQVTEAPRTFRASVQRLGDKAICPDCSGMKGMCQPSEHGGRGACGKAIAPVIDSEIQNQYLAARERV